jgi:hypothetical protein
MQYAKLNLAMFTEHVKNGRYESRTAARRAIGKVTEWSDKDKDAAHALINKTFGESDDAAPKKAKRAAAPKTAKRAASREVAAPRTAKAATAPAAKVQRERGRKPRQAPVGASHPPVDAVATTSDLLMLQRSPVVTGKQEPASASRYNAAASIIATLKNVSPITAAEQELLELAEAEARVNTTPEAEADRIKWDAKNKPCQAAESKKVAPRGKVNGVTTEAAARPHIAVPLTAPTSTTPSRPLPTTGEELAEAERSLTPDERETIARVQALAPKPVNVGPIPPPLVG